MTFDEYILHTYGSNHVLFFWEIDKMKATWNAAIDSTNNVLYHCPKLDDESYSAAATLLRGLKTPLEGDETGRVRGV